MTVGPDDEEPRPERGPTQVSGQVSGQGSLHAGDVLAGRYLVADLLGESRGGRFWRAEDQVLQRHVAVHIIAEDDERAEGLVEAARLSATVHDRRILRVLDADRGDGQCYVVNEWGDGASLDILLARDGPLGPRRAAWIVSEVAGVIAAAHEAGVAHGRLAPENVLLDHHGSVRIIGLAVEAALWGLPQGRTATDVTDLGALLYATLTGRWAGISRSSVPAAHQVGGRVLRPRKVRAGIPRVLDDLCEEVLNPTVGGGHHVRPVYDLATPRGIADALADFVGDPTGLAVAETVSTLPVRHHEPDDAPTAVSPPMSAAPEDPALAADTPPETPAEDTADDNAEPGTPETPQPEPEPDESGLLASVDQPTQAGMPVFDDERDEVAWIAARSEKPPPPPPFDTPEEKPLFAPLPPEGQPQRNPRPGVVTEPSPGYWPWEGTSPGGRRATTGTQPGVSTTGSGIGVIDEDDEDDGVPGRTWLRLAALVGAGMLLLLAAVFAVNLGQGRSPLEFDDPPTAAPSDTASSSAPSPQPVTGTTATDLDPQGDPPEENPDLAPLVVDGNPTTSWRTQTYSQQLGPAGLKTGVGVVVDLGAETDVRRVRVDLVGEPTGVTLFLAAEAPSVVAGLEPVAQETASARLDVPVEGTGRYLVVWLTSLPEIEGGFRGEIAEIVVRS
ncbi:MAG: protein kinase family protein [Nocardioides sp.]